MRAHAANAPHPPNTRDATTSSFITKAWSCIATDARNIRRLHWVLYAPFVLVVAYLPRIATVYDNNPSSHAAVAEDTSQRTGMAVVYRVAFLLVIVWLAERRHYGVALLLACAYTYYFNELSYTYN